jgi:hypothetical protein
MGSLEETFSAANLKKTYSARTAMHGVCSNTGIYFWDKNHFIKTAVLENTLSLYNFHLSSQRFIIFNDCIVVSILKFESMFVWGEQFLI